MQAISDTCSVVEAGSMPDWSKFRFRTPGFGVIPKFFLKERLGLNSMEVSLNMIPPGSGMPLTHRHQENEEVYVFLSGEGEFQADGKVFPIQAGTCVRCAPETSRSWHCVGAEPLYFVVIQAKADSYGPLATTRDGQRCDDPVLWLQPGPTA
jgi:quercetin dioxygenase-like cupin family protein